MLLETKAKSLKGEKNGGTDDLTDDLQNSWVKQGSEIMQRSVDDTYHRIEELELELKYKNQRYTREFFRGLKAGELVEVTGIYSDQGVYSLGANPNKGNEYYEIFPGAVAGDVLMYLGWVASPGEEVVIRSDGGSEKVWKLTGPKWLFGDKIYIQHIPIELLQPCELEIEDEFAQNLGINFEVLEELGLEAEQIEETEESEDEQY